MLYKVFTFVFIGAITIVSLRCDDGDIAPLDPKDLNFIYEAAKANQAAVEFSQLATAQSSKQSVKEFATQIISDRQNAQNSLVAIADERNITLSARLDIKQEASKNYLSTLSAEHFDTAYINLQLHDYQETLALFNKEISAGTEQQVKEYAEKFLPDLKTHLQRAQDIANQLETNQ